MQPSEPASVLQAREQVIPGIPGTAVILSIESGISHSDRIGLDQPKLIILGFTIILKVSGV